MHDWIVEQYTSGESARRIGQALGMAHNAVVERLRLRGVVPSQRGAGRRNPLTSATYLAKKGGINDLAEFDRQVATLYLEGNSTNAIRLAYGVSHEAIRTSLHRSSIPLRSKGKGNEPSKTPAFRIGRLNSARAKSPVRSRGARGSQSAHPTRAHRRAPAPESSSHGLPKPVSGKTIFTKLLILLGQIKAIGSVQSVRATVLWPGLAGLLSRALECRGLRSLLDADADRSDVELWPLIDAAHAADQRFAPGHETERVGPRIHPSKARIG